MVINFEEHWLFIPKFSGDGTASENQKSTFQHKSIWHFLLFLLKPQATVSLDFQEFIRSMASPTKEFVGFQEPTDRLLDPGPPPRPKRKLGCKTILWTLLALLGLGVLSLIIVFLRRFADGFKDPHSDLYQDLTQPYRPQDVVRPLIDNNQTFDIIATVWLRTEQNTTANDIVETYQENWNNAGAGYKKWTTGALRERAIFSKTIFTGLTLKDKQLTTSVDFQVPTSIL